MNNGPQLERLRLAIHGVNAPFSCAGKCLPKKPVALRFKDASRFLVERAPDCHKQVEALRPLIDRCEPATFGDKRRNRFDPRVREAVQLKAESDALAVENFDPASAGILDVIARELLPPDSSPVTAELYALNIYQSGGHFAPHKDTPRGEDMFGTLVVCLPSCFWRGALSLTHCGLVERFDWGSEITNQRKATQLHWAAFFGDVDHQIERVGLGARVTLTYLLRRGSRSMPSRSIPKRDLPSAIQEAWQGLVADTSFLPQGGVVGYPCRHLYHHDARFQVKQKPLDQHSANMLKGRDQLVAAAALQAGLNVTFAPYLFETCIDDTWQLDRFPTRQEKRKLTDQMDLSDLESALPIVGKSSEKVGDFGVTWLEEPPSAGTDEKRADSEDEGDGGNNGELPSAARLHSCEYCEWGYFGNEASYVDFYIYAALHIGIPTVGEGPRAKLLPTGRAKRKATGATRPVKKKAAAPKKSTQSQKGGASRSRKPPSNS